MKFMEIGNEIAADAAFLILYLNEQMLKYVRQPHRQHPRAAELYIDFGDNAHPLPNFFFTEKISVCVCIYIYIY